LLFVTLTVHIADFFRPETEPMHRGGTAAARALSKHPERSERPKDPRLQPQSPEHKRQLVSSHGSESKTRNRTRSSSERREHGHSDRASVEDHSSRKRMRDSSPKYDDKQSSRRSRHGSRSMTTREEDASDDERNFKRRWGRRSSGGVDTRH